MPTKIETIYQKIKNEVTVFKNTNGYRDESKGFGHFMVKTLFNLDDQAASEAITDGGYDNGIDAIYIDDEKNTTVHFFQFKFPSSISSIANGLTDNEITKIGSGVQRFLTARELSSKRWNSYLIQKHREVMELDSFSVKIWVIRYTSAEVTHQKDILDSHVQTVERTTLNNCDYQILLAREICDLFESQYEKKYPDLILELETGNEYQLYETDTYKSITTVCYVNNLYKAIQKVKDRIFDGNVRYYNPKTEVTRAIRNTLVNDSENFMLYNNGITILAEKAKFNSPNKTFTLNSASIINGAQTVGSIIDVMTQSENTDLFKKSPILVRIIEIKDRKILLNEIVYSLNTQTKMFSAYGISNDIRLRELQENINKNSKYFLEIKYNEFENLKNNGKIDKYKKDKLDSEKIIQCYVAYKNINNKAYMAKLNKTDLLLDDNLVNKILDEITVVKALESYEMYIDITKIISSFRSYRNSKKKGIIKILSIDEINIDRYQFLNTGDIVCLFVAGIIKHKYPEIENDKAILKGIHIIADYLDENKETIGNEALSNITKSKKHFDLIKTYTHKVSELKDFMS